MNPVAYTKLKTLQYIPIQESLKNLLQSEDVFREVKQRRVSHAGIMREFTDGQYFKGNTTFLQPKTLGLIIYTDEFTGTNPHEGEVNSIKSWERT